MRSDTYPLTPLQSGMLFHQVVEQPPGVDVEQLLCTLPEAVDAGALEAAWGRVAARHDVLRTSFVWENVAEPIQKVWPEVAVPFRVIDWTALGPADRDSCRSELLAEDRRRGLSLTQAPLFRVTLVRRASEDYELIWTFHHAILDGRSLITVLDEVFRVYEGLTRGEVLTLLPAPHYGDFVAWTRSLSLAAAEPFWKERLRGFQAPTPLPVSFAAGRAGPVQARHADCRRRLTASTAAALEALAHEAGGTLNTLVQAAWGLVLARHAGEEDVVFGAVRAGRHVPVEGIDDVVGLVMNTVPARVAVTPLARLGDWLAGVRQAWVEIRNYEHTPLARVQAWSELPGGVPLFETMLTFDSMSFDDAMRARSPAWRRRHIDVIDQTNLPLTLVVYGGAEPRIKLDYDRERIDDGTANRVAGHLVAVLEGMANGGCGRRVADLPWLTEQESRQVLVEWNHVRPAAGSRDTLTARFAAQVARSPDAVALVFGAEHLTYAELNARANRLAHHLRTFGVGPDRLVAVCLERGVEMAVALLAVLKAGGAYVPLDPAYPSDRLQFMLEDSDPVVVVTQSSVRESLADLFARVETPVLGLDLEDPEWRTAPQTDPDPAEVRLGPDDLAYVIYTSGSTGRPKGVMVEHGNVTRLFAATDPWFHFSEDDVWTLFHSFAFDFSVWEIWGALLYGGTLVVVPKDTARSPEEFYKLVCAEGVTVLNQTPSAFRQFMAAEVASGEAHALRYVIFGGEALDVPALRPWFERNDERRTRLVNMYGITETTVHVTYRPLSMADTARMGPSPIGVRIPDLRLYLLDGSGGPVPVGVVGELYVGGAGVARGYLGRPELTTERFLPNPFGGERGGRLYRTGDLARWLPDGTMEFLGRNDFQVKVRGFRIELGEIEARLAERPGVLQCVVMAREDGPGDRRLVAYVVARPGVALSVEDLRSGCREKLPDFMVPSAFVVLDALPLTPSGKLDRRALPAPSELSDVARAEYAPPRTEAEVTLARIWQEVLHVDRVGATDSFFELGGDSILIIDVISRARTAGLTLTPRVFFRHPRLCDVAAAADSADLPGPSPEAAQETGAAPLTPVQHWFFGGEDREHNHWNQAYLFTVPADFDAAAGARALNRVMEAHSALRLRFHRESFGWRQEVTPSGKLPFESVDLAGLGPEALPAAIEEECLRVQRSLDISAGPLARALHIHLGERPGRLLLAIHHLAVDGVSWRILLGDFETAYAAERTGSTIPLPAPAAPYVEWGRRLARLAGTEALAAERPYWRSVVAGAGTEVMPGPRDRRQALEEESRSVLVTLDRDETDALLRAVPAAYNTQINDVLVTALGVALGSVVGEGPLLVDLEGHGREDVFGDLDLSRTVGWFTTIFPIRLNLPLSPDPGVALRHVKEQLRSIPRHGLDYGILRHLAPEPLPAVEPDLVFNYMGQLDGLVGGPALLGFAPEPTGPWKGPRARRRHRLAVNAWVQDGRLKVDWSHAAGAESRARARELADRFVTALKVLIAHCTTTGLRGYTPSDFPLAGLDQEALDRVAAGAGDIEDIYPLAPMQRLFVAYASVDGEDPGFEQWRYRIEGDLQTAAFARAWQRVVGRHAILRTAFISEALPEPLQVVRRSVELPWEEHDWRGLEAEAREARMDALLRADRQRGFPPERAPLMRMALVRTGDRTHELVWSNHHLLLDRWSWPLVLLEVKALYGALTGGAAEDLPAPVPYRAYMDWLATQDSAASEAYWREQLRGFEAPQRFARAGNENGRTDHEVLLDLTASESAALRTFAAQRQLSLNTLVQGAWALWLAHHFDATDIVYGLAMAGRPAELPGVERMVGLTINNLPVRVRIEAGISVGEWLSRLQVKQGEAQQHAHVPLDRVQEWSGLPWRQRLFETLLVFQSAAADERTTAWLGDELRVERYDVVTRTRYPLTLITTGGEPMRLTLGFGGTNLEADGAAGVLACLRTLLLGMAARPEACPVDLLVELPAEEWGGGLEDGHPVGATERVEPRTSTEWVIARMWAQLLGLERVGVTDNFFGLGGHSLVAMQVVSRLRETFRVDLPIKAVFTAPTVAQLSDELVSLERKPGQVERIAQLVKQVEEMSFDELRDAAASTSPRN